MTTSQTWSIYRDDPVDHVLKVTTPQGYYHQCAHCNGRIFTSDHDCLERFITDHQDCEATK